MANILVTGGAGYLGSILVPELLRARHKVTVLENFMYQNTSLLTCCIDPNFEIIRGDARDKAVLEPLVKQADIIIPLAALVGAPLCKNDYIGTVSTNRDAITLICDLASKDSWILYPNTNSGYGIGEQGIYCTEESPLKPISVYGKLKVEIENRILDRGNSITFRLATVFGMSPRMRIDLLVNDFTYRAVNDRFIVIFEGHFKRNYIHVRDVARAFIHAINNFDSMKNEPYNVGLSNANLSKLELCAKIKEQLPALVYLESEIGEDVDKRDYIVSNKKIEKTGFKPACFLKLGIGELIKGFRILIDNKYGNIR
jgi:nucleoside-diphosphate-sugar epimerase